MELLSPAGNEEALYAAIRNGADAVYLGAKILNARAGAGNFDRDALRASTDYCHERDKKVYVTVNTVVKDSELPLLEDVAEQLHYASADGIIVQDFGVARALSRMLPDIPLHASTQMALHNVQGARFLLQNGYKRMVLAREATIEEIRACADAGIEVEVFGHGALCVACSGQCLFSSMVGGRSGNRGQCAQPCRLPYRLGEKSGYLLSPKDLLSIDYVRQLEQAGVTSLKLEGRLKRPEYVAVVTRAYRRALDGADNKEALEELRQIFNRGGFTKGYAFGVNDTELMSHEKPNHMGVPVGKVIRKGEIKLDKDVAKADQLLLGEKSISLEGKKGEIIRVRDAGSGILMRLADDAQLREARKSYTDQEVPTVALHGICTLNVGEAARLFVTDGKNSVEAAGAIVIPAEKTPKDATVIASLQKTGGTPYYFTDISIKRQGEGFLSASDTNALRRDALAQLANKRQGHDKEKRPYISLDFSAKPAKSENIDNIMLRVQSQDAKLLEKALELGAEEVYFEIRDLTKLPACPNFPFVLVLPPVCPGKDLENLHEWALKNHENILGVLITNAAQLAYTWPGEKRAGYMMNIANRESVEFLRENGIESFCPSVELTKQEIEEVPGEKELLVYGRIPLMQLRHCPLNSTLGGGKHADCSRCENGKEVIEKLPLTDRKNIDFPLTRIRTSAGCIVRVLNSVPLLLLKKRLPNARAWRLLFTNESPEEAEKIIGMHIRALDGENVSDEISDMNYTTGHYFRETD